MPLINPYLEAWQLLSREREELALALRKKLIWAYSWAVPNDEAIATLAGLGPLVELGAGTGYWAWLVAQAGGRVEAYDREPGQAPRWCEVRRGSQAQVAAHPDATLFLCWPPLGEPLAFEALGAYRGERFAYVGEPAGRTADDRFHGLAAERFMVEREVEIPCWPGFRDRLIIYRRKNGLAQ